MIKLKLRNGIVIEGSDWLSMYIVSNELGAKGCPVEVGEHVILYCPSVSDPPPHMGR